MCQAGTCGVVPLFRDLSLFFQFRRYLGMEEDGMLLVSCVGNGSVLLASRLSSVFRSILASCRDNDRISQTLFFGGRVNSIDFLHKSYTSFVVFDGVPMALGNV